MTGPWRVWRTVCTTGPTGDLDRLLERLHVHPIPLTSYWLDSRVYFSMYR